MVRMAMLVLAAATIVIVGGCSATMHATEAGTYLYERPWLEAIEDTTLDRAWQATQDAIADLEFSVADRAKDSLQAKLVADQADGTDVRIELKREDEDSTKVRIKVGTFGDRSVSELVLEKIAARIQNPRSEGEQAADAEK